MSDEIKETDAVASEGVSDTPAAAPTEAPQTSVDPLDQLLAEWDQKYPPQPEVQPSESTPSDDGLAALGEAQQSIWQEREHQWQTQLQQSSDQLRLLQAQAASANVANEAQINQLKGTVGQLQQSIQQAEWRQHQERSQQDFQRLVADEQQKLAGLDVDDKFAETFLLAEASRDPQLAKAWEGQYFNGYSPLERAELEMAIFQHGQSLMAKVPLIADAKQKALAERQIRFEMQRLYERTFIEAERYRSECKRYVQKSLDKMHEVASRRRVDPEASFDRAAVAHAVRGGGKSVDPPMPDLSNLSDRELQKYTRENFGF